MLARLYSYANAMLASVSPPLTGQGRRDTVGLRDAPASASVPVVQWDNHPEAPWRQCLFGPFGGLPGEVLAEIAGYVPDADLASWSRTSHGARAVLRREYLACRLPEAVPGVVTLCLLEKAACDILRFAPRPGHWPAALAGRLALLDESEAAPGFALLLDAADRLPVADQPPLLQRLAVSRYECAVERKHCPIGPKLELRLYRAVLGLQGIDDGHAFSVFMTHCSDQFANSVPSASWDVDVAAMPPAVQATALAAVQGRVDRLRCLPHAAFLARLQLAITFPFEDRHVALAALAVPNAYLDGTEASRRFAALLPAVQSLESHRQPICHAALAYLILPMPAEAIPPAWRQLLAAMPALALFDGAGELLRALHVGIAFMAPRDGAQCRRLLQDSGCAATVHIGSLADSARDIADPVRRHGWDGVLQTRDLDVRFCLPFHGDSPGSRRVRAYQAMTQYLALEPAREARLSPALLAARVRAEASRLDPARPGKAVGFSFDLDHELAAWRAVLQRIQTLPAALQTEPLRELARVSGRSTPLFTPRVFMLSMGFSDGQPNHTLRCWDALVNVVQQLPLEQQLDLARDLSPLVSSLSGLSWSMTMATSTSPRYKAAMLMTLVRASKEWAIPTRASVWRLAFHMALSLPVLQRAGVLRLLRQVIPSEGRRGWYPSVDIALVEAQLRALPDGA